jgi:hypothetical protein
MTGITVPKRIRKAAAVLSVLGRLGFHARTDDVVVELEKYGIDAGVGLVQRVKIEAMKNTSGIRRQRTKAAVAELHPRTRVVRKVPAQRARYR